MATITEKKLIYLNETKAAIKAALIEKGQSVTDSDTFRSYADKVLEIKSGDAIVDDLPIELDFSDGNQVVQAPDGVSVKSAIIQKPDTLIPENVAKGVNIAGVVGELSMPEIVEDMPISLDFRNGDQTITAPDGYVVKSATIEKPSDLIAENIREGKNIAGVAGTMAMPEIVENVPIELDFSDGKQEQQVAAPDGYAVKSIKIQKPADLIPENIAEGVEIAGVVGTHSGGGGTVEGVCYVTFMSDDGTTELYKRAVVSGNDCGDVVELGLIDDPAKESTAQYNYTREGWSKTAGGSPDADALKRVTEDRSVYASYSASVRSYTVRFYDGSTLVDTVTVPYGSTATTDYVKDGYSLVAWNPSNEDITGDTDCYGVWELAETISDDWATISQRSLAGTASTYYKVGDTKKFTITNDDGTTETYIAAIAGFKLHTNTSGTKDGITFIVRGLTTMKSNSDMGVTLPDLDTLVYPKLSSDLQAVVRQSVVGDYAENSQTSPSATTTTSYLFLPLLSNISSSLVADDGTTTVKFNFGTIKGNLSEYNGTKDNARFPLFSSMTTSQIKNFFGIKSGSILLTRTYGWGRVLFTGSNYIYFNGRMNIYHSDTYTLIKSYGGGNWAFCFRI